MRIPRVSWNIRAERPVVKPGLALPLPLAKASSALGLVSGGLLIQPLVAVFAALAHGPNGLLICEDLSLPLEPGLRLSDDSAIDVMNLRMVPLADAYDILIAELIVAFLQAQVHRSPKVALTLVSGRSEAVPLIDPRFLMSSVVAVRKAILMSTARFRAAALGKINCYLNH
jgi:hypothetical protein